MPTTTADLEGALARFGHDTFRPGQREAVEALLEGGRLLLVAPTGGGKSLIYQLPASLLGGTTIVVSPLIALMADQVAALERCGVAATFLASTLDADTGRDRFRRIARGEFDLVYVAPERLMLDGFQRLVAELDCPLVAVDEAHCISEWGHDFRPEYLEIGKVIAGLGDVRVLACTATATPVVRDEILERLGLPAETPQLVHGFARPNLALRALEVAGSRGRDGAVDAVLAEGLGSPGSGRGCAIVYAPTRKGAEEEAGRLLARGWKADHYHAGLGPRQRQAAQDAFIAGDLEVICATNAFGMGIDRPDVRAVVHLGPPGSLEAYYQEVGRAGRDGEPAIGLMLHSTNDFPRRRHLIESDGVAPEVIEHKWNLFLELMRWADGGSCRHDAILRYFGDEAETLAGCGVCDVCVGSAGTDVAHDADEVATVVRKALSGVARVHGRFGLGAAVRLLRGQRDPRLERAGLDAVSTFGVLADHDEGWITRLLRRLVTAGWVGFEGGNRPVAVLTEAGRRVMHGDAPPRVLLPPVGKPTRTSRPAASRAAPAAELDEADAGLFEILRRWRLEVARSEEVPPYVVASDRTLRDIAQARPATIEQLLGCHGIGPSKAERYGGAILGIVTGD